MSRAVLALLALLAASGCVGSEPSASTFEAPEPKAPVPDPGAVERERCDARIAAALLAEPLPGAPAFDGQRARILARAKGAPVLFVRAPKPTESPAAQALRERINSAPSSSYELYEAYPDLSRKRALARDVLLSEGYLYSESPPLAGALAQVARLEHLFADDEIFIHRGARILRAERRRRDGVAEYVYAEGREKGRKATILFLDRVAVTRQELAEPLHRDWVPLQRELGFDQVVVRHIGNEQIVAELRYGGVWVPAVVDSEGALLGLACESVPKGKEDAVARVRRHARRLDRVLAAQRAVIQQQIDEDLPFDEPRTEFGQQDGKLRQEWTWAYRFGRTHFDFNEDRYRVFDWQGRPRVPQVCIDFITDTWERSSGSWYRPRGEQRNRVQGRLDLTGYGIDNVRSVESLVDFASRHPEWFEVWQLPEEERIPLIRRTDFYDYLFSRRDDFQPGDVVTILGLRDDEKLHYHSFFVYGADPVTGMPIMVAANAGRPRVRAWDVEMANAPLRSIKTRIRPRIEWLESVTLTEPVEAARAQGAEPI